MTSKQLWFLISHFKKHRIDWKKSNSIMARQLREYMERTDIPPAGYSFNPISLKDAPVPYEVEFAMSNASDCADWLKDNSEKVIKHLVK